MKLTLRQRFTLIELLPQQGNIVLMRRACELRDRLLPTEAEEKEFGVGYDGPTIRCNRKSGSVEREIDIGQAMTDSIVEALGKLNEDGHLTMSHAPLYEKFVTVGKAAAETPVSNGKSPPA